jgi:hypothetical protein
MLHLLSHVLGILFHLVNMDRAVSALGSEALFHFFLVISFSSLLLCYSQSFPNIFIRYDNNNPVAQRPITGPGPPHCEVSNSCGRTSWRSDQLAATSLGIDVRK